MKTYSVKASELKYDWYVVDATGQNLGRLSTKVAAVLRGKHKPTFTPHMDTGDFVVIVNADKIEVTGKRLDDKMYYHYSGYPGGMKSINLRSQLAVHPERVLITAIRGMLPHNRLGRKMFKKLKVYAGPDHPHTAQQPKKLEL